MSMWLDQKYVGILSIHLEKFKRKGNYSYNFRCPVCGDSQKSKIKARGYIFPKKGGLFYKCHNCQVSISLGNLIKYIDKNLYDQYCLERYKSGETGRKAHKDNGFVFKQVKFDTEDKNLIKKYLTPLKKLDEKNAAIEYVKSRKIPEKRWKDLYYVDSVQILKNFSDEYEEKIYTEEDRLVLPFIDEEGGLLGLTARALHGESLRYLTMKLNDEKPMIFGLNYVDRNRKIYVTEGPIDSLFLPNSVATGNANLKVAGDVLPKENLVLIYDNEPRNKEIVREMKSAIDSGFAVCVWNRAVPGKDINEITVNGSMSEEQLVEFIDENTYSGAKALLNFNLWRV